MDRPKIRRVVPEISQHHQRHGPERSLSFYLAISPALFWVLPSALEPPPEGRP